MLAHSWFSSYGDQTIQGHHILRRTVTRKETYLTVHRIASYCSPCIKCHLIFHWLNTDIFLSASTQFWHDQGKWVTCRKFQFLLSYTTFSKLQNAFILMQTPLQLDIWLQSYEGFDHAKNNMKQRNLNTVFANISKTLSPTSDSFLLIMSQFWFLPWWHDELWYLEQFDLLYFNSGILTWWNRIRSSRDADVM